MKVDPFQGHWCNNNTLSKNIPRRCPPWKKMVSSTSVTCQTLLQRCYSHWNSVNPTTLSTKSRSIRAPIAERQATPLTSSNCRWDCQSTNTETNVTRSPSEISRCLSPETTTDNTTSHQVSHFTAVNPLSSLETSLITDIATYGSLWYNFTNNY